MHFIWDLHFFIFHCKSLVAPLPISSYAVAQNSKLNSRIMNEDKQTNPFWTDTAGIPVLLILLFSWFSPKTIQRTVNIFTPHLQLTTCGGSLSSNSFPSEKLRSPKSQGTITQTAAKHCNDLAQAISPDHFFRCDSSTLFLSPMLRAPAPSNTAHRYTRLCFGCFSNTSTTAAFQWGCSTSFQHSTQITLLGLMEPWKWRSWTSKPWEGSRGWDLIP